MECPFCEEETKQRVIDKRNDGPNDSIRRRRMCTVCGGRWTTFELREDLIEFGTYEEEEE